MKRILMIVLASLALMLCGDFAGAADIAKDIYSGKGEVMAVDMKTSKIKLRHEAIPELQWPAMTMFFPVKDTTQMDSLKPGDRVEFQFVRTSDGAPQITQIKTLK